jgi:hypothetical protein
MARLNVKDFFKQAHVGKDMYVIAGGASLNYVNPNFFDDKITIGLNQSFSKFKHCTYYLKKDGAEWQGRNIVTHVREVSPESKIIMSDYHGCAKEWGQNIFDIEFDYYYFDHPCGHGELDISVLPRIIDEGVFPNGMSITSIGIAMAAFMGAKNIIVCGMDACFLDDKDYFDEYVDHYECPTNHSSCLSYESNQAIEVSNYLRGKGINIIGFNPFINLLLEGHRYHV